MKYENFDIEISYNRINKTDKGYYSFLFEMNSIDILPVDYLFLIDELRIHTAQFSNVASCLSSFVKDFYRGFSEDVPLVAVFSSIAKDDVKAEVIWNFEQSQFYNVSNMSNGENIILVYKNSKTEEFIKKARISYYANNIIKKPGPDIPVLKKDSAWFMHAVIRENLNLKDSDNDADFLKDMRNFISDEADIIEVSYDIVNSDYDYEGLANAIKEALDHYPKDFIFTKPNMYYKNGKSLNNLIGFESIFDSYGNLYFVYKNNAYKKYLENKDKRNKTKET